jgi:hypothetical protein
VLTVTARLPRSAIAVAGLVALASIATACGSTTVTPGPASPAEPSRAPSVAPVTAPPPTPVGSTADAPPCAPPDVAVDVNGQGATGSIVLFIVVTNRGSAPCALDGPPSSIGLRAGGGSLPLTYQPRPDPWPGDTPGLIAPPVVLTPGEAAMATAIWNNWCLGAADVSTIWVGLGKEAVDTYPQPPITPARCDNANAESTLAGFPFEARAAGS